MSDLIISVSGLRGIVGTSLTPDLAARYVAAFAVKIRKSVVARRPLVIVGRDGRSSGLVLKDVVSASLRACGCDVVEADVVATPTIGVLVKSIPADAAIQITASHNPAPYNGLKLFAAGGRVLNAEAGSEIRAAFERGESGWVSHDELGASRPLPDPHAAHLASVLETVDVDRIVQRRFKVLLNSNHGAGGILGRRLLEHLDCQIVAIGESPDGEFEHVPEPTEENLQSVASRVAAQGCEVGFCQDPDADRLALIDASGRYIGEEYTLALCVRRALSDPKTRGPVVINSATSSMSQWLATEAGVPIHRSAVGEANVVDCMLATGATYGGEGNGGPIDPRVVLVRDSFVGMAQVLDLMASSGKSLAELVDELPRYAIQKDKVSLDGGLTNSSLQRILAVIESAHPDARAEHGDGLRLAWPDSWLLVRGSNTEPIVRMIAEAPTKARASRLCESAAKLISSIN